MSIEQNKAIVGRWFTEFWGKAMRFTGTTILKVENGLITEEIGLDDGVAVLQQLGLITTA